jgi:peptidyl-prolyl cis-trans isomerase C
MIKIITQKKLLISLVFSGLFSSSALMAEDKIIVMVNGQAIHESQLKIAATQSKIDFQKITAEQKQLLTEALVNRQLVLEQAKKANYDKQTDVAARIKALTESYLAANYLTTIAQQFNINEDKIKQYYETKVANNHPQEFKARHILVKTEKEANTLIKDIESGADFSTLAKEKSTDTGSGSRGGDLGWFSTQDMVAPFAKKIASLKKGELGKTPVNSQFGWHVVILDDIRTSTPPKFKAVQQDIEKVLLKNALTTYLNDLNANAKIILK